MLNAFRHHGLYRQVGQSGQDALGEVMCSTPFGITDYIGSRYEDRSISIPRVLNAFRHHGLYRSAPRSCSMCILSYRVLNAFRHHGLYRPQLGRARPPLDRVLNAFRHHGLYRSPPKVTRGSRRVDVLNAFRHHGLYRVPPAVIVVADGRCSTPFGITDYIGYRGRGGRRGRWRRVLNAFRHHGLYRPVDAWRSPLRSVVHVLNAFRHHGLYRPILEGYLT